MNCDCNNSTKIPPKIKHVFGNVLRMAIPLTLRTLEYVDNEIVTTDSDFIPSSEYPVTIEFIDGKRKVAFNAHMQDGNVAVLVDDGTIPVGIYAITVLCQDDRGRHYRFKQRSVIQVVDVTADAGIVAPIEYEVNTWYLDAALFLALRGEDGVGIEDIVTQSSSESGGINTVNIYLTDGRVRTFTIMNGAGTVDQDFDSDSLHPLANKRITERFEALDQSLADLFGSVDYDSTNKLIRFWNKEMTTILGQLDATPFIKDETISNVYISNGQLVITFNTSRSPLTLPLSGIFNPNNYYTRAQTDSRIASAVAGVSVDLSGYYTKLDVDRKVNALAAKTLTTKITITDSTSFGETTYTSDKTIAQIYEAHSNGCRVIALLGDSVGQLTHCDASNAQFLFAELNDDMFMLVCNDDLWWREEVAGGSGSIEIDDNPTEDSENAVSSGGVYLALSNKVSGVRVNNGQPQYPVDGIVSLSIQSGGGDVTGIKVGSTTYTPASGSTVVDISSAIPDVSGFVQSSALATVATSGSYNDLTNKPNIPAAYDDTTLSGRVTALENAGFITTETDPTVPSWAKADSKPTYTAQEVGALPASTTIPTKVSDLTNDSGFTSNAGTITGITMNGASKGTSGVVDLGTVITAHQDISGKANASDVYTKTQTETLLASKQNTLTFDTTPTANSTNPVTSGGIKTYVDGKATIIGITTSQDGTFTISLSNGDSYTVNLNHVHPQYAIKKTVESNTDATVTLSADVIYDLGTVAGNKVINLPTTVDAAADYEFRLAYTSGTIGGTAISGTTVANDATLTFTAGKTYQVIISGGILYFSETTVSA